MQLVVDHLLTSYSIIGEGSRTVLCLHGWADSGQTFNALARQLVASNKELRFVLLDLPGFGNTQAPEGTWGLFDYAEFVGNFLHKINVHELEGLIGHSNGGAIAITALSHDVFEAQWLVLIGSAGVRQKSAKKTTLRLLSKPAKLALKAAPQSTQRNLRQKAYSAIGSDYLIAEHMQETFKKVVSQDVSNDASKIELPVCIIYGEQDDAAPPLYGRIFHEKMPHSTLEIIAGAGHFVHQDDVQIVSKLITDFIK